MGLLSLDLGRNPNLSSNDMADLRLQGIDVDYVNALAPNKTPDEVPHTEHGYSWIPEGIICLRQPKKLYNTYGDFKNYSHEKIMKITRLEFFYLIPVDYIK